MSPFSIFPNLPITNHLSIFLCFLLFRVTSAQLVASSQRLVQIGQTFEAICHFERSEVGRFLYWTVHYYNHYESENREFKSNIGGIDLTTCSAFSFDASNSVIASKTELRGLTGQITCDLKGGPMRLHINKIRPEFDGFRFSCNSGRDHGVQSNKVTLKIRRLVTLGIHTSGDKATCIVDRSLNPQILFWATRNMNGSSNGSTLGGMIVDSCFPFRLNEMLRDKVDFNCKYAPDPVSTVSSTLTSQSLSVGTVVFCFAIIKNDSNDFDSKFESNRLAVSDSGRFTKISVSTKNSSVPTNGTFSANCRLLSSEYNRERIIWQGISKFESRVNVVYEKEQTESTLIINPIFAYDDQSQVSCSIVGGSPTESHRVIINVINKVPISVEMVRSESTIEAVPINGTFKAVCSFRNIEPRVVRWVITVDHVIVGRVNISEDVCQTRVLIKDKIAAERVQISCDMDNRTTTFTVQPVTSHDTGTDIYCTATDHYGHTVRSDTLSIRTQDGISANIGVIVKMRPTYREATHVATCPFGNGTETVFLIKSLDRKYGEDGGDERARTGNDSFVLLNRNCSIIDYVLNIARRFYIDCEPDTESVTLIIDPVKGNTTDDLQIMCTWYASYPSGNASIKPERKMLGLKHQIPRVIYPVSKPVLTYRGYKIKFNETDPDILTSVWLISATLGQEMEFSCSAGVSQSSNFNISLYIQTDGGFSFRLPDETKYTNGSAQISNIRQTFRIKPSYVGVFCVAENIVSRWESDFARILVRTTYVFISLDGWMPTNSSFLERRMTPTLELCYSLCELYKNCRGISYHHKLCSLSTRSFPDSQILSKKGFTFHQRLLLEDLLERNNFWPDVYKIHENRTLPFSEILRLLTDISEIQCQKECSKLLPCRSIQFTKSKNMCHLSNLISVEGEETTDRKHHDWDVYTKNNTPGSFIAIRGVSPSIGSRPIFPFLPDDFETYENQLMQCADYCRNRDDCVSFVSTIKENRNSMVCSMFDINIPRIRLEGRLDPTFRNTFYSRVRSIHSELVPVNRHRLPPIA